MSVIFSSLFTGFGLADVGAQSAGCELAWGIELDAQIADVSRQLGHTIYNQSVLETNFFKLEKPDILWASPPCPNFSVAKTGAKETALDKALAIAVLHAIEALEPRIFILENVEGYKRSKSLELIEGELFTRGYWCDRQIINAADFGVPQTRRRLILRAVKGGFVPSLPPALPWVGWYEAIEDLIPDLPETKLANWQLERMPKDLRESLLICGMGNRGEAVSVRRMDEPALTVTRSSDRQALRAALVPGGNASSFDIRADWEPARTVGDTQRVGNYPKAVLIESKNPNQQYGDGLRFESEPATTVVTDHKPSHQPKALLLDVTNTARDCTVREAYEPSMTITAEKMRRPASTPKALLNQVRVVQMTSRALARFQTLPDWYELPEKNTLACKGIGNGVPCRLSQELICSLRGDINER